MDFNSSHVDQHMVSWFPYPIWRDEGMHDLLVRVAKSAADAVAQSGRSSQMGAHVMVRVDIALTRQDGLVGPLSLTSHDASKHFTDDHAMSQCPHIGSRLLSIPVKHVWSELRCRL